MVTTQPQKKTPKSATKTTRSRTKTTAGPIQSYDCQCQLLQVSLANEVLSQWHIKQGSYQLSDTINGKSSWKSAIGAIWFRPAPELYWMIGALEDIGTSKGAIASDGDPKSESLKKNKVKKITPFKLCF